MEKLQLFDQTHGLSRLEKCQFSLLFKSMFIFSRTALFLLRRSPNTFSGCILHKTNVNKTSTFWPKPCSNPFPKNANFVGFWNRCFPCSERLVYYLKRRKSFFTIYFHDLWPGNTSGYKGLQGVTRSYRGLQGVTGGDKGLQGVTKGDRGWQGVTGNYKGS